MIRGEDPTAPKTASRGTRRRGSFFVFGVVEGEKRKTPSVCEDADTSPGGPGEAMGEDLRESLLPA